MRELLCRLGLHDFPKWSDPQPERFFDERSKFPEIYSDFAHLIQERTCRACNIRRTRSAE